MISDIPCFLLVGTRCSVESEPVRNEVACFLSTNRQTFIPVLMEDTPERVFPADVRVSFPNAIYADLRLLKTASLWRWFWSDRRKFKSEMLRIVSSVLSVKTNTVISYEALVKRDRQQFRRRVASIALVLATILLATLVYVSFTPERALRLTEIGKQPVTDHRIRVSAAGVREMFIKTEEVDAYIGEMGHSGDDTKVTIHLIDDHGQSHGTIEYWTETGEFESVTGATGRFSVDDMTAVNEVVKLFEDIEPESPGSGKTFNFELLTSLKVKDYFDPLMHRYDSKRAFQVKGVSSAPPCPVFFTEDGGKHWVQSDELFFLPEEGHIWQPNQTDGVVFIVAQAVVDAYDPFNGGIFRSLNFGKTWESMPFEPSWDSFSSIVSAKKDSKRYAVVVTEKNANNRQAITFDRDLLPSAWLTKDAGTTWQLMETRKEPLDAKQIELIDWTDSDHVIAIADGQLVIYRKRSWFDRLLGRFDDI